MAPKIYLKYASPPCRSVLMVAKAIGVELEIQEVDEDFYRSAEFLEGLARPILGSLALEGKLSVFVLVLSSDKSHGVAKALDIILMINPQHTVPTLEDEDFVLWDSHAIAGYLVGQYAEEDTMYPKDDVKKRALIDQRLHFDNGVLFERCRVAATPLYMGETDIPEEARDKLVEAFGFLEAFLKDKPWLAGEEVTIADLSILATMVTIELFIPVDAERFPLLADWLQRGKELPYFEECNRQGLDAFKGMLPHVPFEASENA